MDNYNLDHPLIAFTKEPTAWTVRDSFNGLMCLGGIGSGKSSSMRTLALKYLSYGYGGLVLCAKSERATWEEYCRLTGREQDLLVVSPGSQHSFDFLAYESTQTTGKAYTENILQVLRTVIRSSAEKSSGKTDDPFFETALDMLVASTVELLVIAYGKVTVQLMYDVALSVMNTSADSAFEKALQAAKDRVRQQIEVWELRQGREYLESLNDLSYNEALFSAVPEARQLKLVDQFFIDNFRQLSPKTRSIVEFSFTGFLYHMMKEPVYSMFCSDKPSTFTPEDSTRGRIILLDVPVLQYNKAGRDIQILFKYCFQRAMLRRNVEQNGRPVFIWSDETQHFLHEHDAEFQATTRSYRVSTVLITQNLPNLYSSMGGERSEHRVKSLLGTLGTKLFFANADTGTNEYASSLIGEGYEREEQETVTSSEGKISTAQTMSVKLAKMVRPEQFSSGLRTGSPVNNNQVDAYIHVQGKQFANGFSHKRITFKQDFTL